MQAKFPILTKLAMRYLAIPATSAASERVWSRASRIISMKRARLSLEVVERIMFVRENNWILHKYYEEITGKKVKDVYLPVLEKDDADIGQNNRF